MGNSVHWPRIAGVSLIAALAAAALTFGPVLVQQRRAAERDRREKLDAALAQESALKREGISKCNSRLPLLTGDPAGKFVLGTARLSIDEIPSWENGTGIRLIGHEVHLVVPDAPMFEAPPPRPPPSSSETMELHHERASRSKRINARVFHAPLSSPVAQELLRFLDDRISQPGETRTTVLDGTTFVFKTGAGCAQVSSPGSGTGAEHLVQLADLLARHARLTTPAQLEASNRHLSRLIDPLQDAQAPPDETRPQP